MRPERPAVGEGALNAEVAAVGVRDDEGSVLVAVVLEREPRHETAVISRTLKPVQHVGVAGSGAGCLSIRRGSAFGADQ